MREYSVWLLPDQPAHSQFSALIQALAAEFGAPVFEPHITLFVGSGRLPALHQIVRGASHAHVHTAGVGDSPQLFKTVFARIQPSAALSWLAARAAELSDPPRDYVFEPHLSLIYKTLPAQTRAQIAAKVELPAAFSCDAVCLVVPSAAGWEDVGGWQIVDSRRLGA